MASAPPTQRADVVLVGGGLANSLIALRLKSLRPRLRGWCGEVPRDSPPRRRISLFRHVSGARRREFLNRSREAAPGTLLSQNWRDLAPDS